MNFFSFSVNPNAAEGSVLPEFHTLLAWLPRHPGKHRSLGAESLAKSPSSLEIFNIFHVHAHCWPWSRKKQCSCRGNKNLIYGSFPTKPFIYSLLYYQNECKKPQFQQNEATWLFLKMCISQHSGFAQEYREHLEFLK